MILQDIIDDHKSILKEANKDEDLVDVLLKIQKENCQSQNPLTDDDFKSIIQVSHLKIEGWIYKTNL
jgi:hypothetical protein